ncbi:MAG: pyridoxamine 5'-phosphate oxidase family protein [Steroidobacteraceae bacterium]
MSNTMEDSLHTLRDLIKDIKFAMFTTRTSDGTLVSRPLTTQALNSDDPSTLWFFISKAGGVLNDITGDHHVGISYADPGKDTYVSVSGKVVLDDSLEHKKALWSPMNQAWFPNGPSDPDVALLRVDIKRAHYWDVQKNKLTQLYDYAIAALTGSQPRDLGESVEVEVER